MERIKISVYCMAYNCAQFIEKTIHGMLNQNINAAYKLIIHDDASTDGTAQIIKKYAEKYPDKICAILQSENQYSKGIDLYNKYIAPNIEGDYIAICEGDDMWIDADKLQMQYDYMEQHAECSLCTHNTIKYNLKSHKKTYFNHWTKVHELSGEEIFTGWRVHTSSFFLRRNCRDWPGKRYWFGDYMMLTWAFHRGKVVALPQVMSQYNAQNPNGVTYANDHQELNKWVDKWKQQADYLEEYNILTQYKYEEYTRKKIELVRFQCFKKQCDNIIFNSHAKKEVIEAAKRMKSHTYFNHYIHEKKGLRRLLQRFRYEGYIVYPLWKPVVKSYLKSRL